MAITERGAVFQKLVAVTQTYTDLPAAALHPQVRLDELGLDSLDLLSLILAAEDSVGVNSQRDSFAAWSRAQTLGDIELELQLLLAR